MIALSLACLASAIVGGSVVHCLHVLQQPRWRAQICGHYIDDTELAFGGGHSSRGEIRGTIDIRAPNRAAALQRATSRARGTLRSPYCHWDGDPTVAIRRLTA